MTATSVPSAHAAPTTLYVKGAGAHLAYQTYGSGELDILIMPGFVSHVERAWEHPSCRAFLASLMGLGRLIMFDRRGVGLSDRVGRFTDAIAEAMRFIVSGEAEPVIDTVIAQRWPGKDPVLLRRAADAMAKSGLWDSALIDRGASDRWMRILAEGGLVSQPPTLDELIGSSRVSVSS